ncbi:hypothetical protein ACP70R_047561 [Stipagrostis hirtigluma subsp. patula]
MAAAAAPPPRRAPAAAAVPRALLPLVADAVLIWFVGALWALNAASVAVVAARWACGGDSRAAAVARRASAVAMGAAGLLTPLGAPLLFRKVDSWRPQAGDREREIVSGGARMPNVQRRPPVSSGARRPQDGGGPVSVALLVAVFSLIVMLLGVLVQELAPAKGSYLQKLGSVISDTANLVTSAVLCFFLLPCLITKLKVMPM